METLGSATMKTKKILGLASALTVSAALPLTAQENKNGESHYMMHGGDAEQVM